jgi:flagellar hook-associated protein 3 FlgL
MRVSNQQRLINHQQYIASAQVRMDRIQQELATGKKIQRASDDPAGSALALQHRKNIAFEGQMRRNIDGGLAFMNVTESALDGATQALQRARELTIQASNDTLSPEQRSAVALEIGQLIEQVGQMANTKFGDAYVFSGHQTDTAAYTLDVGAGTVTYNGDDSARMRRISHNDQAAVNLPGSAAFGDGGSPAAIFEMMLALKADLEGSATAPAIGAYVGQFDAALDRVLNARAEIGSRINRFETALSHSELTNINLQELRSDIEEIDLASSIIELTGTQASLEAALAAIGRTNGMTLLNFLR